MNNFELFLVSYIGIFLYTFNDIFVGWKPALVFIIFLILNLIITKIKNWSFKEYFSIFMIIFLIIGIRIPRESMKVFYPEINENIIVKKDIKISNGLYSPNHLRFILNKRDEEDYKEHKIFTLHKGEKIHINKKLHTDIGFDYYVYNVSLSNKIIDKEFKEESKKYRYTNSAYPPDWYSSDKIFFKSDSKKDKDILFYNNTFTKETWFSKYTEANETLNGLFLLLFPIWISFYVFFIIMAIRYLIRKIKNQGIDTSKYNPHIWL